MSLKVLVISEEGFSSLSGGGILKKNLFALSECYQILSLEDPIDNELKSHHEKISIKSSIIRSRNSQLFKYFKRARSEAGIRDSNKNSVIKLIIRGILGNVSHPSFMIRLDPKIMRRVCEFKPDLIYTTLGSYGLNQLVIKLATVLEKPLVVHIMDDWISATNNRGLASFFLGPIIHLQFKKLLQLAARNYVISGEMRKIYEERYGLKFTVLHNGIEDARINSARKKIDGDVISIGYVGSLIDAVQVEGINDLIEAVKVFNAISKSKKCKIHLFISPSSFDHAKFIYQESDVITLSAASADDNIYHETLRSMNILFIPSPFNIDGYKYTQFSVPAKLPSYLASNNTILGYGPENSVQMKMMPKDFCWLVHEKSIDQLVQALLNIQSKLNTSNNGSVQQYEYTKNNYSLAKIQNNFFNELKEL